MRLGGVGLWDWVLVMVMVGEHLLCMEWRSIPDRLGDSSI